MLEERKQGSVDCLPINLHNYLADKNCRDIWEMTDHLGCSNNVKENQRRHWTLAALYGMTGCRNGRQSGLGLVDWPSCVMQMEPLPIPTLRASAPASIKFFAWAAVTTATDRQPMLTVCLQILCPKSLCLKLTIAADDLYVRIFLFYVLNNINLKDGISLGRVLKWAEKQ